MSRIQGYNVNMKIHHEAPPTYICSSKLLLIVLFVNLIGLIIDEGSH